MIVSGLPVSVQSPYAPLGRTAEPEASLSPVPVDTVARLSPSATGGATGAHVGIWRTVGTVGLLAASIMTGVLGAGTANAASTAAASSPASVSCPMPHISTQATFPLKSEDVARMEEVARPREHENATARFTRERYAKLVDTVERESWIFVETQLNLEAEGKLLESYASRGNGSYKINDNCTVRVDKFTDLPYTEVVMNDAGGHRVATLEVRPSYRHVGLKEDGDWKSLEETDGVRSVSSGPTEFGTQNIERIMLKHVNEDPRTPAEAGDFQIIAPSDWGQHFSKTIVARGASIFSSESSNSSYFRGDFEESFVVQPVEDPAVMRARFDPPLLRPGMEHDWTREVALYQDGSADVRQNGGAFWQHEPPASGSERQEKPGFD